MHEEADFHTANQQWNALPSYLRSPHRPPAESGPVKDQQRQRQWALSKYIAAEPKIRQDLEREKADLNRLGAELEKVRRQVDTWTPQERRHYNQQVDLYKQRGASIQARSDRLRQALGEHYQLQRHQPNLSPREQGPLDFRIYDTTRFPDEIAADPEKVMSFGPIESLVPGAVMRENMRRLPEVRGGLFFKGLAPKPLTNPGQNPQERQQYTQQLQDLRGRVNSFMRSVPASYQKKQEGVLLQGLTPWQRSIYPQLKQHLAFEALAQKQAGVPQAFVSELIATGVVELLAPPLAPLAQRLVGKPLQKLLGRALASAAVQEQLARAGGRKLLDVTPAVLKRFAIEKVPEVATHAVIGGALGGPTAAGMTLAQGGSPEEALKTGLHAVPEMAAFGGITSLLFPTRTPEHPVERAPTRPVEKPTARPKARRKVTPAPEPISAPEPIPSPVNRFTVEGQEVHTRTHPPSELERIQADLTQRKDAGLTDHPENVAEATLRAHTERHNRYQERQTVDLVEGREKKVYLDEWGNQRWPERRQFNTIETEAGKHRETNPELAAKLDTAKLQAQDDFTHRWRIQQERKGNLPAKETAANGPAQASIWRILTPEEKAKVGAETKRDLLIQDISNSKQVIEPGSLPDAAYRRDPIGILEDEADRLYSQAEEAHHREITAAAYEEVGLEPAPPTESAQAVEVPPTEPVAIAPEGFEGLRAQESQEGPPKPVEPGEPLTPQVETQREMQQLGMLPEEATQTEAQIPKPEVQKTPPATKTPAVEKPTQIPKKVQQIGKRGGKKSLQRPKVGAQPPTEAAFTPASEFNPGEVYKKKSTGLTLRLEESTEPGKWTARVLDSGTQGIKKGSVMDPVTEESLKDFTPVMRKQKGQQEQQQQARRSPEEIKGPKVEFLKQRRDIASNLEEWERAGKVELGSRDARRTSLEKNNLQLLKEARTGLPITLTGFRYEQRGTRVPETGVFYTIEHSYARQYGEARLGEVTKSGLVVDNVNLKNPLVIKGGHLDLLMNMTEPGTDAYNTFSPKAKESLVKAANAAAKLGERGYILMDKAIAQAAKESGYDGIIYRRQTPIERVNDTEIVDLSNVKITGYGKQLSASRLSSYELLEIIKSPGVLRYLQEYDKNGAFPRVFGEAQKQAIPQIQQQGGKPLPPVEVPGLGNPDDFFDKGNRKPFKRDREVFTESTLQKSRRVLDEGRTSLVNALTRSREHLPSGPEFAGVHDLLDTRSRSHDIGNLKAELQLGKALNNFTSGEQEFFDAAWFALDAVEGFENQYAAYREKGGDPKKFKPVPPEGYSIEGIHHDFDKAGELMKGDTPVGRALVQMHDLQKEIWDEYRNSYERATGRKIDAEHFFYLRRLISAFDEKGQYVGSGKVAVKRPDFTRHRKGGPLPYGTNFVRAAMEWMPRAIQETINLKLVHHVDEVHNIAPGIAFERIRKQSPKVYGHLIEQAKSLTEEIIHAPERLQELGELAHNDFLPDTAGGQFQPFLEALSAHWQMNEERTATGLSAEPLSMQASAELKKYSRWLLNKEGGRKSFKRSEIPPGYREYPMERLQQIFPAFTIPERIGQEAMLHAAGEILQVPAEKVRKQLVMGRRRPGMIIPEGLAKTFDNMGVGRPDTFQQQMDNVVSRGMLGWKWWTLMNPLHAIPYVVKTYPLHAGPILRKAPGALIQMPEFQARLNFIKPGTGPLAPLNWASRQVKAVAFRNEAPTDPIMKAWVDRGGLRSTQLIWEGMEAGTLGPKARESLDLPGRAIQTSATWLRAPHDWRERALRLATFKHFVEQMKADPRGMPKDFAASNPAEVMALPDIYDRAWRLADDLNFAYGRTSAAGKWWGKHFSPFWSVQELLVRREGQFLKNTWNSPAINLALGRKIAEINGVPSIGLSRAIDVGKMAGKLVTGALALEALNQVNHPEAESNMSWKDKLHPHLTLTYDRKNNTAVVLPIFRNPDEALRWFGFNHIPAYWDEYINGKKTIPEILKEMVIETPLKELWNRVGLQLKIPAEWLPGLRRYPDLFRPVPIKDRWEEAFKMMGAESLYRAMYRHPQSKRYWIRAALGLRRIDLGEAALYDTRDNFRHFREKRGVHDRGVTLTNDARSMLLYRHRQALRMGDRVEAFKLLLKGASDKEIGLNDETYVTSVMNMEPLNGIKEVEEKEFLSSLSFSDRERLRQAYYHWQMTFVPEADTSNIPEDIGVNFLHKMRDLVLRNATREAPVRKEMREDLDFAEKVREVQKEREAVRR